MSYCNVFQIVVLIGFAAFLGIDAAPVDEDTVVPEQLAQQAAGASVSCTESMMKTNGAKGTTFSCEESYGSKGKGKKGKGKAKEHPHTIKYYITVPSHCTATSKCGIVVNSHGLYMGHQGQEHATGVTKAALGGRKFIVIGPEDKDANWAFSFVDPKLVPSSLKSMFTKGNDDGHIVDFTRKALKVYKDIVDPKHVHAMGYSQGSIMTWSLMCKASDLYCSAAGIAMAPQVELAYPFTSPATYIPGAPICWNTAMGGKGPAVERSVMLQLGSYDFYFTGKAANTFQNAVKNVKSVYGMTGDGTKVAAGKGVDWTRYTKPSGVTFEAVQYDFVGAGALMGHCVPKKGLYYPSGSECGHTPPTWTNWYGDESSYSFGTKALDFFDAHKCK